MKKIEKFTSSILAGALVFTGANVAGVTNANEAPEIKTENSEVTAKIARENGKNYLFITAVEDAKNISVSVKVSNKKTSEFKYNELKAGETVKFELQLEEPVVNGKKELPKTATYKKSISLSERIGGVQVDATVSFEVEKEDAEVAGTVAELSKAKVTEEKKEEKEVEVIKPEDKLVKEEASKEKVLTEKEVAVTTPSENKEIEVIPAAGTPEVELVVDEKVEVIVSEESTIKEEAVITPTYEEKAAVVEAPKTEVKDEVEVKVKTEVKDEEKITPAAIETPVPAAQPVGNTIVEAKPVAQPVVNNVVTPAPEVKTSGQVVETPKETKPTVKPTVKGNFNQVVATEVYNQLNAYRAANGLPALSVNTQLVSGTATRAEEFMTKVLSGSGNLHARLDGSPWYTAFAGFPIPGENLAYSVNGSAGMMNFWKNSPSHNAAMLSKNYTSVTIQVIEYQGTYYGIQIFS